MQLANSLRAKLYVWFLCLGALFVAATLLRKEAALPQENIQVSVPSNSIDDGEVTRRPLILSDAIRSSVEPDSDRAQGHIEEAPNTSLEMIVIGGQEYSIRWEGNEKQVRFPSGALYTTVHYVDGKKDGLQSTWYESGQLHGSETYREGARNGVSRFFSDQGIQIAEGLYLNDYQEGWWTTWYEHGVLESEGAYTKGKMLGHWTFQLHDGSLNPDRSGVYLHGERLID